MKRNFLVLLAFVMLTGVTTTSCKKDDDTPTAPNKRELLTKAPWKGVSIVKSVTIDGKSGGNNQTTKIENLEITFSSDGTFKITNTDIADGSGKWELLKDDTILKLEITNGAAQLAGNNISGEMEVKSLTSNQLKFAKTTTTTNSGVETGVTSTATFKR